MENKIIIEKLVKFSHDDSLSIKNLVSQLGNSYKELTEGDFYEMLNSSSTHLLIARDVDNQKIVGMITIIVYRIPYIKKSYLDDFVVDENYRGKGIGTKLFNKALEVAREKGAEYVDFTSSPEKIQGNKFYEKLGFKKRETNVYRLNLNNAE